MTLKEHGVYVEQLAGSMKGTVLYVVAENLGAHSLAGFQECFAADRFCCFVCVIEMTYRIGTLDQVYTSTGQKREP